MITSRALAYIAAIFPPLAISACGTDDAARPAGDTSPSKGAWRTLAPMPTPRTEVAVAELDGKIYVIGGFEVDGAPSAKVEVYDPATDTWSEAPPLPEPRHHAGALGWYTNLLVIGGFGGESFDDPKATVFKLNTQTGLWIENPPLHSAHGAHAVANLNGNPVVVGGAGRNADGRIASLRSTEVMHFRSERWYELQRPFEVPRDHLAAATVTLAENDLASVQLHVIGGRSDLEFSLNLDAHESSQPLAFRGWSTLASLPTARSGIAAVELDARIYVFGGEGQDGTFDTVEAYDPETDSWQAMPPMPTARHGLGAAVVGDTIYVIGGGPEPGLSVTGANEAFMLHRADQ
jgi:hypothetical protein